MIELKIDGKKVKAQSDETLLQAAQRLQIEIPTLCYLPKVEEKGACLVCGVWDLTGQRYLPACSAHCQEGMEIDASSEQVKKFRQNVMGLLLSEHRGDCEAPCTLVCPQKWNIPLFMRLLESTDGSVDFHFNPAICESCGGKCEKVCRRLKLDKSVEIRKLLLAHAKQTELVETVGKDSSYIHRDPRVSKEELQQLDQDNEKSGCLQCACRAKNNCQLRLLAGELKAKRNNYIANKPDMLSLKPAGLLLFEANKCLKCGRCVRLAEKLNPALGPVLSYRGQKTTIIPPIGSEYSDSFSGFEEDFVKVCPTGAIAWKDRR